MEDAIKQFVPQEVCLSCQGCCRFREENSAWSPCLLEEEIESLIDRADISAALLTMDKRLAVVKNSSGEGFICPFLNTKDNKCGIYAFRPFECRIYPFLISMRNKKVYLTVDLNCPYIKERINTKEFKEYLKYLTSFLNAPKQLRLLKDNPHIIQAYEEVLDIVELDLSHDA